MTKHILSAIILTIIILIGSCGESGHQSKEENDQVINEEKEQVVKQKKEQVKNANEKAISDLNHKHNAVYGWDSLVTFTYILQEMFIDEKKPMSFVGEIKNITKSDSNYLLKVHHSQWHYYNDYLALISISIEDFIELEKILKSDNHSNKGCFIIEVTKIISSSPKIISDIEMDGEDSYSSYSFDFDGTLLIIKGDLIDYHIDEIIPRDNDNQR
jgi:hypothetical protein